jgi:hypothetical protein
MPFDYSQTTRYATPPSHWYDPLENAVNAVTSPIGDAAKAVLSQAKSTLQGLPAGQAVIDAIDQGADWTKELANASVGDVPIGQIALRSVAMLAYGPLAMSMGGVGWFGPQLASAVWAVPDVLRQKPDQNFFDEWAKEVVWRTEELARQAGPEAAKEAMKYMPDGFRWLSGQAAANFPDLPLADAMKKLDITPEQIAKALNIRPDLAALLLKFIKQDLQLYVLQQFDIQTGRRFGTPFENASGVDYVTATYGNQAKLIYAPQIQRDNLPRKISFDDFSQLVKQASARPFFEPTPNTGSRGPIGQILLFALLTSPAWLPPLLLRK